MAESCPWVKSSSEPPPWLSHIQTGTPALVPFSCVAVLFTSGRLARPCLVIFKQVVKQAYILQARAHSLLQALGKHIKNIKQTQPLVNCRKHKGDRCGYRVVVCFLGTRLHSCASLFLKIRNPKSQSTNLAGSLDGAPIIAQSRRHKPCSKIEVSYSAHSQVAFDAFLLFTDCQRDCDCDLRFARCCTALLRCCCSKP